MGRSSRLRDEVAWRRYRRSPLLALLHCDRVDAFLAGLGFVQIGEVVDHEIVYGPGAAALTGDGGAVYVFLNPDGRVWKVGMTHKGFVRVDYTRVFDGRAMRRSHEQRKLEGIRREVQHGATQWVRQTDDPELVETLLSCLLRPTESNRRQSKAERVLRRSAEVEGIGRDEGDPPVPSAEQR